MGGRASEEPAGLGKQDSEKRSGQKAMILGA